tara:strand:+ start:3489 stop:3647 length:159 start_codon:yes stop_codon:yes gene_type:complete
LKFAQAGFGSFRRQSVAEEFSGVIHIENSPATCACQPVAIFFHTFDIDQFKQ